MSEPGGFGIDEVMRRLPHRYPMLLVDRVLECVPGERIVAVKNVTVNEPYFAGHFPGRAVIPHATSRLPAAALFCYGGRKSSSTRSV